MEVLKIIDKLGGAAQSAVIFNVHQVTVDRWKLTGIPVKYWRLIINKTGITSDELLEANGKALQGKPE